MSFSHDLLEAVRNGDMATIDATLANGADINAVDEAGKSVLIHAVLLPKPNKAIAGYLIDKGADTDICDTGQGFSALAYAIQVNRLQTAKLLLQKGADPNTRDLFGNTPMFRLVLGQRNDVALKLLLHFKADKDAANENGATPRQIVQNMGDPELIQLLA